MLQFFCDAFFSVAVFFVCNAVFFALLRVCAVFVVCVAVFFALLFFCAAVFCAAVFVALQCVSHCRFFGVAEVIWGRLA